MATAVNESDIFTCPICLEKLKSPQSLPCLHTFCELCIGEFILSTERRTGHKLLSYHCPVCRSVVTPTTSDNETSKWAASPPRNLTISSKMDQAESTKQECHMCKRQNNQNVALHWCRDCSEAFCEECLRLHNLVKFCVDHKVVKIEEINTCTSGGEPELSSISDTCSLHQSKILDVYCFDHQELCCVHCLTLHHRKCENVQAIDMMENLNNDIKIETLTFELTEVKSKMDKLAEERNFENEKLISVFKQIETDAKNTVVTLKEKLDCLLVSVIKELNLIRDEQTLDCDKKLETVKTFLNRINQLQNMTNVVRQHGTLNQKFIHFERSKIELKSAVKEASRTLNSSSIGDAKFVLNETMNPVVNADCLGKINITKNSTVDCDQYEKEFYTRKSSLLDKTRPPLSYDNICLQHRKTIYLPGFSIYAFAYISEKTVIIGGHEKSSSTIIKALDISNENILAEYSSSETIKRLEYDFETKSLFVSCNSSKLFSLKYVNEFNSKITIKKKAPSRNYDLCVFEGILYVMVDNAVHKIKIENVQEGNLQTCFTTDANCTHLNGLVIDCKNRHLLYTSNGKELICVSLDGKIIFSYKDEQFNKISSLAVHPQGIIIIGSREGAIYAVSEDGKRMRVLLDNCKEFKCINNICCNTNVAVCGSEYLEIYDVTY
ncbi:tripartite motif-containing protein 45-like [Mytilus californianus]|uniref:tripartite motif-containing protein 45-like n=1 Tax=Mytilus californianus TaxID=6549 RepID=UPI002245D86F|nr:tripartite motif-containing protein 45-like [Mytilus californianus]